LAKGLVDAMKEPTTWRGGNDPSLLSTVMR
jgi:hypothetical protein